MKKDARNFMLTMISIPAILAGAVGVHALSPAVEEPITDAPVEIVVAPVAPTPIPVPTPKVIPAPAKKPIPTPKPVPTPVPVVVTPAPVVQTPAPSPVVVTKKTPTKRVRTTRAS